MKILGCGIPAEQMYREFLVMNDNDPMYKNLEFTWTDDNIDYFVIISFALDHEYFIPERTIIFQMEPWVYDLSKNWGVHAWVEHWRNPDPKKFLHVRKHIDYLNAGQWMFSIPKEINLIRHNKLIAVISEKTHDTGHQNRINMIRYIEDNNHDIIDVYGTRNHHNFKSYKGTLDSKILQQEYKYVFTVENSNESNYATEKIWESFITTSLAFYDGCPNLSDYINPLAYVAIDTTKKEETLQIMLEAIQSNLWLTRLPYIKEAKELTINEYGFFPLVDSIINKIE